MTSTMGRSQNDKTQKSLQAERELTNPDNPQTADKLLQQRQRRNKANSTSTKHNICHFRTQEQLDLKPHLVAAAVNRKERVQQGPQYSRQREHQNHTGSRRSRAHPSPLSWPHLELPQGQTPQPRPLSGPHPELPQRQTPLSSPPSEPHPELQKCQRGPCSSPPSESHLELPKGQRGPHPSPLLGPHLERPKGQRGPNPSPLSGHHPELPNSQRGPHPSPLLGPHPEPPQGQTPNPETVKLSKQSSPDSDSDLSESERLPLHPSPHARPPQLCLRPEIISPDDFLPPQGAGHGGQNHGDSSFPDFLPPPFNSWNLGQLSLFYNTEGRASPRPKSGGPLERYLDRLLQLEWRQFQTVQEEGGRRSAATAVNGYFNRSPHTSLSTRLSCPKSILQCQCAFPLVFLSSHDSHATQLSGCSCTACRALYSSCCRSHHSLPQRQSCLRMLQERRSPDCLPPPRRSYSESRSSSSDKRAMVSGARRLSSPARSNGHKKRMQAFGNIRNPVLTHTTREPQDGVKDSHVGTMVGTERESGCRDGKDTLKGRGQVGPRRSQSEQRKVGTERELGCRGGDDTPKDHRQGGPRRGFSQRRGGSERFRSGSECRSSGSEQKRSGSERRRAAVSERPDLKPEVIGAIVDHLLGSKTTTAVKPRGRLKHVEFVTK